MSVVSLPLSDIIPVSVIVAPLAVPGLTFNQGLIVGSSVTIPSIGANSRLRLYTSVNDMLTDGFSTSSPEYLSATLYFGQTPQPTFLWVGRQDLTAIQTVAIGASAGTGYVVGDLLTVVQGGASGGVVKVTTIGGSGAVTGVAPVDGQRGTGYAVASNLVTSAITGSGSGFTVSISTIGETALQSVTACRIAQPAWYACMFVGTAADADHEAIAGYIEAATPASTYFLTSGASSILNNTTPNLFAVLKASAYRRTWSIYSTTQSGAAPNNIYASAAAMGKAMGLNTGAPASYFDLMFKQLAGVIPEPLTQTQVNVIGGTIDRSDPGLNGNLYLYYQNGAYLWVQNGTMSSGVFFDEVLQLDMLANDCQTSGVNLLVSLPSLPLTDGGVNMMKTALAGACQRSQSRGFIAPAGKWLGVTIGSGAGSIQNGDNLPIGWTIYAPPVSTLSAGQRAARILPSFTIVLIEAGSAHSLAVSIVVQR